MIVGHAANHDPWLAFAIVVIFIGAAWAMVWSTCKQIGRVEAALDRIDADEVDDGRQQGPLPLAAGSSSTHDLDAA